MPHVDLKLLSPQSQFRTPEDYRASSERSAPSDSDPSQRHPKVATRFTKPAKVSLERMRACHVDIAFSELTPGVRGRRSPSCIDYFIEKARGLGSQTTSS
jgi:hypothetical protein